MQKKKNLAINKMQGEQKSVRKTSSKHFTIMNFENMPKFLTS